MGTAGTSVINSIWARLVSFITGNNTRSNLNVEQYWCHSNSMVPTNFDERERAFGKTEKKLYFYYLIFLFVFVLSPFSFQTMGFKLSKIVLLWTERL